MTLPHFYSLDASAFISGWAFYPPEVFPGLWQNLKRLANEGRLLIAEEVYQELKPKDEELESWIKGIRDAVVPLDEEQQKIVADIMNNYNLVSGLTGKSSGDPFVIALAKARNAFLITEEKPTGNIRGPRIPDACKAENILWGNFIEIPKREKWSFK